MKFDIPKKEHPNLERYYKEDIETAYRFANEIYRELGSLIRAVVIFGSTARKTRGPEGDIAGFGENWIAAVPSFAYIYRGPKGAAKEEGKKAGMEVTEYEE